MNRPIIRARDLGDGPHRPFGSALSGNAGLVERCPRIGPTVRLQSMGPCKVCGERRYLCEHDIEEDPQP